MNTSQPIPGSIRSKLHPVIQELISLLNIQFVEPKFVWKRIGSDLPASCGGVWSPEHDFISVKDEVAHIKNKQDYYFLHELTHWTGHKDRLNRRAIMLGGNGEGPAMYDTEEATAELGMYKLACRLGLDVNKAKDYMEQYLSRHPFADLHKADRDAEAAVAYILEKAYGYVEVCKAA